MMMGCNKGKQCVTVVRDKSFASLHDSFLPPNPPSCPNGAPKLTLAFFFSLMPPFSNSVWALSSTS